jgi:hypothetical protein
MKLEGSNDSAVQNNDAIIENEQVTEVNDQITDSVTTTNEDVSEEVNEDQNVLTFNSDDDVLEYLKTKEELLSKVTPKSESKELPEDVKKYLEFKEDTGRGYSDFLEYQRDFSQLDEQDVVKRYMKEMNPEFDNEDIQDEFLDTYAYDEDLDDDRDIRKKTRAFKKAHADALEYFNSQKEKYAIPLGSNDIDIPAEYKSAKEFVDSIKTQEELSQKQNEVFLMETENLFTDEFKGFEFKIGNEVINHKPVNIQSTKESQSNVMNFLGKFLDENGFIKDSEGYHKALYVAMNYESILSNVYETAKAKAIEDEVKNSKNIDMGMRKTPESLPSGMKFKLV